MIGPQFKVVIEAFLLSIVVASLAWGGVVARYETWAVTAPLRYDADMENGWNWGSRAAQEGYFSLYDRVAAETRNNFFGLDYLPLRLAAMTIWADGQLKNTPPPTAWQPGYEFNRPLLRLNTACEAMTAIGIGLLSLDWIRRDRRPTLLGRDRPLYGVWLALLAFAVAWFNPASLVSAHGRPTWDVWVTPFYVWAVLAATRNHWLAAGCIVGVGAMFKGQQLFGLPFLVLWPLMRFRFGAAGRLLIGFALAVALVASPWLVGPKPAAIAFVLVAAAVPIGLWWAVRRWPIRGRSLSAIYLTWAVPAALVMAIVACVPLFDGSINWLRIGLIYGAEKFGGLEMGGATSLTALLQKHYDWQSNDRLPAWLSLYSGMTISHLLIGLYGLSLPIAAWAASRYEKCGDRRFVLAVAMPWIVYFTVFPKMHERYLLWGATVACAGVIVHFGALWLAIFFTLCSTSMSLLQMATGAVFKHWAHKGPAEPAGTVYHYLNSIYPGLAWAVMLATLVWLWMTAAGAVATKPRPALVSPAESPA